MESALVNRTGRADHLGRILIDHAAYVEVGALRFLCLEEGDPEPEVLVVRDELGRIVGIPTGRTKPCPIPTA